MVVTVASGMHQTIMLKIHTHTVKEVTLARVLLMGVASKYLMM